MRMDGIQQAMDKSRGKQKSETKQFTDAIKELTKRSASNQDIMMKKGINYRFSLKDLPKYSQKLNEKDTQKADRLSNSALGKKA